jgi:S1-C subfamily serine protease
MLLKTIRYISVTLLLLISFGHMARAQESPSAFKYAVIVPPTYGDQGSDIYGMSAYLRDKLASKSDWIFFPYGASLPDYVNDSEVALFFLEHSADNNSTFNNAKIIISTTNRSVIYTCSERATALGMTFRSDVKKAIAKCVKQIHEVRPHFDPSQTVASKAERFSMKPEDFYSYLDDAGISVNEIEGVWQESEGNYIVGVIRTPGSRMERYKGFIVEQTEAKKEWSEGIIKFELTPTAVLGRYSATFKMSDFSTLQMQVSHRPGFLTFSYSTPQGSEDSFTYVKMYPGGELPANADVDKVVSGPRVISSGSGFVVARNKVLTNAHVVKGGNYFELVLSDSVSFPLRVLQLDEANDIAVLGIMPNEAGEYPSLLGIKFGEAASPRIGEEVFTIGFPLSGVLSGGHTATNGSISALSGLTDDPRYFQISVPIQPGNSGGPLFNDHGEVIGVITSKLSDEYAYGLTGSIPQNVNFALKIDYVLPLLKAYRDEMGINRSSESSSRADLIDQLRGQVGQIVVYE